MISKPIRRLMNRTGGRSASTSLYQTERGNILDLAIALEAHLLEYQTFDPLRPRLAHTLARWRTRRYGKGGIKPDAAFNRRVENPSPGRKEDRQGLYGCWRMIRSRCRCYGMADNKGSNYLDIDLKPSCIHHTPTHYHGY